VFRRKRSKKWWCWGVGPTGAMINVSSSEHSTPNTEVYLHAYMHDFDYSLLFPSPILRFIIPNAPRHEPHLPRHRDMDDQTRQTSEHGRSISVVKALASSPPRNTTHVNKTKRTPLQTITIVEVFHIVEIWYSIFFLHSVIELH
jgi:hypothetical protein